ncbi:MAG TPA: regulatory iron-sulfur-containing complex subunit RicT [candidate division Zixibacteria bacterium]|nr:hypothetical protein [candidate division Zixibacteria bacterium]MDD4916355.1 regulatory iron-sulfur-containing complex subunit RicT [candidate division Zixibacteria bacterium]MDM7972815.1 regulatory iron-sulfur-containing complex subunit RicT [candidate division Zixibacteria bacterium]HOD66590.1 regulatory iron-sulfur-containing complex subunit RicT [candidate division Zixibacteria bacterium]HPM37660.1 regulatory iron-sulfur-containing complex subunit RicT [candidate division Zixibacteria ba
MAELYLVEFKGSRKEFFFNRYYHALTLNSYVIVEVERGEELGYLKKKIETEVSFGEGNHPRSILRPAGSEDAARWEYLRDQEEGYKYEVIDIISRHGLPMKVVDVECQFDGNKMTVFFTADHRVDFRELVKDLAARYRTRIELRQIGVRDEARRLGGYGICGREQCCNSFIRNFEPISTQHAREQDLPLNPSKISGNCGRLLCCLRYEADMYRKVKSRFPEPGTMVRTRLGEGVIERIDVFNEEAIIRDAERVTFRVGLKDILERERKVEEAAAGPARDLEAGETEAEALKKLDEGEGR